MFILRFLTNIKILKWSVREPPHYHATCYISRSSSQESVVIPSIDDRPRTRKMKLQKRSNLTARNKYTATRNCACKITTETGFHWFRTDYFRWITRFGTQLPPLIKQITHSLRVVHEQTVRSLIYAYSQTVAGLILYSFHQEWKKKNIEGYRYENQCFSETKPRLWVT